MSEQPAHPTPLRTELDNLRTACKEWADRADTYRTRAETAEAELATVRHTLELRSAALDRVTRGALDGLIANCVLEREDMHHLRGSVTRYVTDWKPVE